MSRYAGSTVGALYREATRDPARPVITYYDDGTGERTELSGATLDNWVAKTANLLVDGLALGPGDTAVVLLPPHWQTAAVLLGCWSAGVTVSYGATSAAAHPADVAFAAADRLAETDASDVYALALAPLAAPLRPGPPAGVLDYVVEVRGHADRYAGRAPDPTDPATPDETHERLCQRAKSHAADLDLPPGARVLVDGDTVTDPVDWLLAPLAAGGSVVLCRHLDRGRLDERAAAERVTSILARAA